jgi:hypothetical protein
MPSFHTTLTRERKRSALELLAEAKDAEEDDDIDEDGEVELELEVFYNPGYYVHATYEDPSEGEDPELTSVTLTEENGDLTEMYDELTEGELHDLVRQAWDHQENDDYSDEGDPDAYDNARDMAMEDEYHGH